MFASRSVFRASVLACALVTAAACGGSLPRPNAVRIPTPIAGNTGKYLSPYTSDGTVAPWVRKARTAQAGATIGAFAGRKLGEHAVSSVPFVGGFLGKRAGGAAGRAVALALVGGAQAMQEQSDLSFASADQLAVYLYSFDPTDEAERKEKDKVISLTYQLYPDVKDRWEKAIKRARLRKGEVQSPPVAGQGIAGQEP